MANNIINFIGHIKYECLCEKYLSYKNRLKEDYYLLEDHLPCVPRCLQLHLCNKQALFKMNNREQDL